MRIGKAVLCEAVQCLVLNLNLKPNVSNTRTYTCHCILQQPAASIWPNVIATSLSRSNALNQYWKPPAWEWNSQQKEVEEMSFQMEDIADNHMRHSEDVQGHRKIETVTLVSVFARM